MRFIENSPVFRAHRVQTPILMLHNDNDDAVPWYQGIEYYLALRRLNKEVYMFNYNGEPHGLRRRPNQKDYTMRLQQFFDHFLKGAPAPEWMEKGIPYLEREQEKERYKTASDVKEKAAHEKERAQTGPRPPAVDLPARPRVPRPTSRRTIRSGRKGSRSRSRAPP